MLCFPTYECSFTICLEILRAPTRTHHHVAGTKLNINLKPIFVVAFPLREVQSQCHCDSVLDTRL